MGLQAGSQEQNLNIENMKPRYIIQYHNVENVDLET